MAETNQFLRENSREICEKNPESCKSAEWAPRSQSHTTTTQENYLKEKANPNYTGYIVLFGFLLGAIIIALLIYIIVVLSKKTKKQNS